MRHLKKAAMLAVVLCAPAFADAPSTSLRPLLRPGAASVETTLSTQAAVFVQAVPTAALRPQPRPATPSRAVPPLAALAAIVAPAASVSAQDRPRLRPDEPTEQIVLAAVRVAAPMSTPRPEPRPSIALSAPVAEVAPESIQTVAAVRILPGKSAITSRKGSVCGDPSIKGEVLAPITSRVKGCGIAEPVRVTSIDGVALTQSAVINCDTAVALKDWITGALKPAFGRKEVASLRIAGSYSCRPRNNVKGAPISEHGRGKAVDIAAIQLANGTTISVASDWRRSAGKPMKAAYRAACGTFGTTLSPDADRYHRDHMHFDTARQRGGAYCR